MKPLLIILFALVGCGITKPSTKHIQVIIYDTTWKTIKKDSIKWNTINKDTTILSKVIVPIYIPFFPDSVNVIYTIKIQ